MSQHACEPAAAMELRLQQWLHPGRTQPRLPLLTEGEANAVVELLERLGATSSDDVTIDALRTLIIRILDRLPA
jgi:hypothetical protein